MDGIAKSKLDQMLIQISGKILTVTFTANNSVKLFIEGEEVAINHIASTTKLTAEDEELIEAMKANGWDQEKL